MLVRVQNATDAGSPLDGGTLYILEANKTTWTVTSLTGATGATGPMGNTGATGGGGATGPTGPTVVLSSSGSSASFAATDSVSVTFATMYTDSSYWLDVGAARVSDTGGPVTVDVTSKTASGFTLTASAPFTGQIGWSAAP